MTDQTVESSIFVVREIEIRDAARILEVNRQIDLETKNMLLEPNERTTTLAEQEAIICKFNSTMNQVFFVAERDNDIIGFLVARGGDFARNRKTASVVIGVLRSYWGQGVGASLIDSLRRWAIESSVHRLELTVLSDNSRAISLYKSKGFVVEGRRLESLCVDGDYLDEYYMAMLV